MGRLQGGCEIELKVSFSTTKAKDSTLENHIKVPYGAGKRNFPRIKWMGILILIFLPFLYLIGQILWANIFTTSPGMIYLDRQVINSPEDGIVEEIKFNHGDAVNAGNVLIKIKRRLPENYKQIALLEAERETLTNQNAGSSSGSSRRKAGGENVQLLQENLSYYQQLRDHTAQLLERGAATQAELNEAETKVREIKAALAGMNEVSSTQIIENQGQLRLAQVENSLASLRNLAEISLELKANKGGTVDQILVSTGQSFAAGEPLVTVLNSEKVRIVTYVEPDDFGKVQYGNEIMVKILSSKRKVKAVVEKVPIQAELVPKGISESLYPTSMRGIQVILKINEPLHSDEFIDGLPVTVIW